MTGVSKPQQKDGEKFGLGALLELLGDLRDHTIGDPEASYEGVMTLVRCFYGILAYLAATKVRVGLSLLDRPEFDPLWPVLWLRIVPWEWGVSLVVFGFLGGSFLAAAFPRMLLARLAAFIGVFQFLALKFSYGKINHSTHLFILVAFVLLFLPERKAYKHHRAFALDTCRVFWSAQAVVLLTYTMAGLSKLLGAAVNLKRGQPTLFHPGGEALGTIIAGNAIFKDSTAFLAEFLMANPALSYILYLGAFYLELFSIVVAFRPNLLRFWAVGLMGLHVGILLGMGISFMPAVLLVAVILVSAPFSSSGDVKVALMEVPVFGDLFRLLSATRGALSPRYPL